MQISAPFPRARTIEIPIQDFHFAIGNPIVLLRKEKYILFSLRIYFVTIHYNSIFEKNIMSSTGIKMD